MAAQFKFKMKFEQLADREKTSPDALAKMGKPVIGWFCTYTPIEIFYAAGLIPYRIMGTHGSVGRAGACLSGNLCSYVMSSLDSALQGKLNSLSGVVIANSCDAMRRLYDAWRYYVKTPFVHMLDIPRIVTEESKKYFQTCLKWLIEAIENHYKVKIGDEDSKKAIEKCNETRRLLAQLYDLRKNNNVPITGSEVSEVIKSSMVVPIDEFNRELKSLLADIKKQNPISKNKGRRLLISGGYVDYSELIKIVEGFGDEVVCEDICTGLRWFEGEVSSDGNPIVQLSERYLEKKMPCARMIDADRRLEYLLNTIDQYKIDKVIYFTLKFCDTNLFEFPYLKTKLKERGTPVLFLETDGSSSYVGQIKTRVEAFLEVP